MNKYITCFDVETTGLNPKEDFIIQLAVCKFEKETFNVVESKAWYIKPAHTYNISEEAQNVHGISKEFLEENGVYIKDIIPEIDAIFKDCDILTYNGNTFDIKFLIKDLKMFGYEFDLNNRKYYDAYAMECRFNPRDLSSVYFKYTGNNLEDAHNALSDVNATISILQHQLKDKNLSWQDIDEFKENNLLTPDGTIRDASTPGNPRRIVFSYGKYKDSEFMDICKKDPQYIDWFMKNLASDYTKNILRIYYKENRDK